MLLVILGHSCAFWSGNWFTVVPVANTEPVLNFLFSWLTSFHIYTFTLVSGYLFAYKILGGAYKKYSAFIKNKAERLLIPYTFAMMVWVAPISAFFYKSGVYDLFKTYILCINPSQLWFLWMLFDIFVIIWPLKKMMLYKPTVGWIVSIAFYCVGLIGSWKIPNVFCVWTACQYVPFFYIGIRIRSKEENHIKRICDAIPCYGWLIIDLLLYALSLFFAQKQEAGTIYKLFSYGSKFIVHIVGSIMAFSILNNIAQMSKWKKRRKVKILSSYSLPIYLFHQQIIYISIIILNGKMNPWGIAIINFIVAFVGSFIISKMLMKWRKTRILIGQKN